MNKIKLEQFLATIKMQNKTDVELITQYIKDNQKKGIWSIFSFPEVNTKLNIFSFLYSRDRS